MRYGYKCNIRCPCGEAKRARDMLAAVTGVEFEVHTIALLVHDSRSAEELFDEHFDAAMKAGKRARDARRKATS